MAKKTLKAVIPLSGIHCAACSARLLKGLEGTAGIEESTVNTASQTLFVSYDPGKISQEELTKKIESLDFGVLAFSASPAETTKIVSAQAKKNAAEAFYRFILSLILTLILLSADRFSFSQYTVLFFAFLIWGAAGLDFHRGLIRAVKAGSADMNTLVSMSTSVIFFYGLASFIYPPLSGGQKTHWTDLGMLVTFINFGRWLESRYKSKAGEALEKLIKMSPKFARKKTAKGEETVTAEEIGPGDCIVIRPGEQIPADGTVTKGFSSADESLLTGETTPADKEPGAKVYAGSFNLHGSIEFTAEKTGEDASIMRLARAVQEGQSGKNAIQNMTDRISGYFVPAVMAAALLSGAVWLYYGGLFSAVKVFAAVLAVACPCAMGLAVPMAVAVGFSKAASYGVLIRNTGLLDRIPEADTVIFDKTGTLTEGKLRLLNINTWNIDKRNFLGLLVSAENRSEHPFAKAVKTAATEQHIVSREVSAFTAFPGLGIKASLYGREITAGNEVFFRKENIEIPDEHAFSIQKSSRPILLLAENKIYKGYAELGDTLRPDVLGTIADLRAMGIEPVIASGDRKTSVKEMAEETGVKDYYAGVFPEDKKNIVQRYKALGHKVIMVGDGFNDAPALTVADIGITLRSGTELAAEAGDITLMNNNIASVVTALRITRAIKRIIIENLVWAFVYNILLIPAAAGLFYPFWGILLPPQWAGAAMGLSSVSVVMNSLRLRKLKVKTGA